MAERSRATCTDPPDSFIGKHPVIINIHGGLPDQYQPDFHAGDNYFTNALGIAVVYPNVRGSSGYGKTFMSLDDGPKRLDAVRDVGALLEWIAGQADLDPSRVMLEGASYGGYLALSAAAMYSSKIRGVISELGVTNLATFIERTQETDRAEWRSEIGDERDKETREFLDRMAPVNTAEKISKPALVVIGGKDIVVSVAETEHIVSELKSNRIPVWYILAKNEGHGFANWDNFAYASDAEILFSRRFLLGDPSSDLSAGGAGVDLPQGAEAEAVAGHLPPGGHLPTADEVLDRYVQALGGRAALLKVKTCVFSGTLDIPATGYHADIEYWREAPNKLESQDVVSDSMTTTNIFDGVTAWSASIEGGIHELKGDELYAVKSNADFYPSLHLKDRYPKMEVKGVARVGDAEAFVIDATRADGKPAKLLFDVRTGLLLRTDYMWGDEEIHEYLSDYKDVGGVKVPFTIRVVTKDDVSIQKIKEIRNNVKIDESRFVKPKAVNHH